MSSSIHQNDSIFLNSFLPLAPVQPYSLSLENYKIGDLYESIGVESEMVNIPVKFKRVAAAFGEMSRVCSSESSGSEHSADLSDLVNSFFEREIREQKSGGGDDDLSGEIDEIEDDESERNSQELEIENLLRKLFDRGDDGVKRGIYAAVENALEVVRKPSSPEFKRRLMARLRGTGLDAGLCKSKWEKNGSTPSGNYEYVDVNTGGRRYIVEVFLAGEFKIARATASYTSLVDGVFPKIFVGKPEEVKQIVRQMCKAIKRSLKHVGLNVPPWRRLAYMQAKWFGPYKRSINEVSTAAAFKNSGGDRLIGFSPEKTAALPLICRGAFAARRGGRIGNLTAVLNQGEMHAN